MNFEPLDSSDLLGEWAGWEHDEAPFILEADRVVLTSHRSTRAHVTINGWSAAYEAEDFGAPGDKRLHLGLLPQPFCGDLRTASVYVLLLNPGLGLTDYYGEYEVAEYRLALLATLKQEFRQGSIPFLFLNPQFAWHGGFGWWHGKLAGVIERLAAMWSVPFAEARARLGRELAGIELFPYHSGAFRDAGGWIRDLHSVALARRFVQNTVIPRVERGEAVAIVTRQAKVWNLPEHPRIIRYSPAEARAAHLSPGSRGGQAILSHLSRSDSSSEIKPDQ